MQLLWARQWRQVLPPGGGAEAASARSGAAVGLQLRQAGHASAHGPGRLLLQPAAGRQVTTAYSVHCIFVFQLFSRLSDFLNRCH